MEQPLLDWLLGEDGRAAASTLISATALVVSLTATWITLRNKSLEDRRQVRSSVNTLLSQVYDLRTKNELEKLELRKSGDYQSYNLRTNANLEHLTTIVQLAKEMIEQDRVPMSASGYAILATALAMTSDPAAATYWSKAVEAAVGWHQKSMMLQNYGTYLYEVGRPEDAKKLFDASASLLASNAAGPFVIGRHHHVHAITQQQAGLLAEADASYEMAARYYASVSNDERRIFAEQSLAQSRLAQVLPVDGRVPVPGQQFAAS